MPLANYWRQRKVRFINLVEFIEDFLPVEIAGLGRPFLSMKTHLHMRFYLFERKFICLKQKHSPLQNLIMFCTTSPLKANLYATA